LLEKENLNTKWPNTIIFSKKNVYQLFLKKYLLNNIFSIFTFLSSKAEKKDIFQPLKFLPPQKTFQRKEHEIILRQIVVSLNSFTNND